MDPACFLHRSDMVKARSPLELHKWVMGKFYELSRTPKGKLFANSGAFEAKKLRDELHPLAVYAKHEFGKHDAVSITPNLGNDNYDAEITIGRGPRSVVRYVEITRVVDGYDESLRMEVLSQDGQVSLTGRITNVSGRRGSADRTIEIDNHNTMVKKDDLVRPHLELVVKALCSKAGKRYGRSHVLVVAVDDGDLRFGGKRDADKLRQVAAAQIPRLALDFARVVFVGLQERVYLSFEVKPLR